MTGDRPPPASGPTGSNGSNGPTGSSGSKGPAGSNGPTGPSVARAQLDLLAFALGALGRRGGRTWALVGGLASAMALLSAVVFLTEALRAETVRARDASPDLVVQRLVGGRPALVDVATAGVLRPLPGVAS
ncbi:MAG TPA: hypothetical protein VFS00_08055, partial [Polyangiaceae bacterium]|nr:hypothetical protein [Polyangiaceae bacterium]